MSKNKTRTKDKYRVVYNDTQRIELENEFRLNEYIAIPRKQEIAEKLQLSERQIKIWFQNRRAKKRKQQKRRQTSVNNSTNCSTTHSSDSTASIARSNSTPSSTTAVTNKANSISSNNSDTTNHLHQPQHYQAQGAPHHHLSHPIAATHHLSIEQAPIQPLQQAQQHQGCWPSHQFGSPISPQVSTSPDAAGQSSIIDQFNFHSHRANNLVTQHRPNSPTIYSGHPSEVSNFANGYQRSLHMHHPHHQTPQHAMHPHPHPHPQQHHQSHHHDDDGYSHHQPQHYINSNPHHTTQQRPADHPTPPLLPPIHQLAHQQTHISHQGIKQPSIVSDDCYGSTEHQHLQPLPLHHSTNHQMHQHPQHHTDFAGGSFMANHTTNFAQKSSSPTSAVHQYMQSSNLRQGNVMIGRDYYQVPQAIEVELTRSTPTNMSPKNHLAAPSVSLIGKQHALY